MKIFTKRSVLFLEIPSGHGAQVGGVNYLIPANVQMTTIKTETALKRSSYSVDDLLNEIKGTGSSTNIIILDACRTNPWEKKQEAKGNINRGLGEIKASNGYLIAYATAADEVASDNQKGKNGLYTKYLKQYLFNPGLSILDALTEVSNAVVNDNPDQTPWISTSLLKKVCLGGCTSPVNPTVLTSNSPLLSFVNGAATVEKGKTYTVKFKATDKDKDLSHIQIDWLDGSDVTSKNAVDGIALSFTHNYAFAGIYPLVATAIDNAGNVSKEIAKSLTVKETPVAPPPVKIPSVSSINLSSQSITQGDEITFSANLSSALPAGYSVKVNYGNGFVSMNGAGKSFTLTAIPKGSAAYKIGIYDSNNALKSNQLTGNFSIVVVDTFGDFEGSVIDVVQPVTKTTGYSKIANNGSVLSDDAKLGSGSTDWACTKDNKTGLIWEVKTTDGGLRDWKSYYSWYEPDANKNGGFAGYQNGNGHPEWCKGSECDTYAFTNAVNTQSLCGNSDWRLPTNEELKGLLTMTSTINQPLNNKLYIDANYFPNTNYWFWSSSPNAGNSSSAWYVGFYGGNSNDDFKDYGDSVRLVRG